jgi:hypothetical protein
MVSYVIYFLFTFLLVSTIEVAQFEDEILGGGGVECNALKTFKLNSSLFGKALELTKF